MQITVKTNRPFYHPTKKWVEAGTQFIIEADEEGTPLDPFWASVIKDAAIDNAVSITNNSKTKK